MSQFALSVHIADNQYYQPAISPAFNHTAATRVRHFHRTLHGYQPTPLCELSAFAKALDIGHVLVKDESQRFDLNSFKMLGSTWVVACLLCNIWQPRTRRCLGGTGIGAKSGDLYAKRSISGTGQAYYRFGCSVHCHRYELRRYRTSDNA